MTGEMAIINQKGVDSNGDCWTLHASIARAVKGILKPFDSYQGPYIMVDHKRLWVSGDGGVCRLYREDTDTVSQWFFPRQTRRACRLARALLST